MKFSNPTQLTSAEDRLQLEWLIDAENSPEDNTGSDVIAGLSQNPKSLPPRYFYDDLGSQFFEQICQLPEYYLTRTETQILEKYSLDIAKITGPCELVELGSGSSTKTRLLLESYAEIAAGLRYLPIDVSAGILETSARELLTDYAWLNVRALVSTYEVALGQLASYPRLVNYKRMICFLGSTLGNLSPAECDLFFSQVSGALQGGDYFLLGVDLHKSKEILEPAYDDSQGVTAKFNLNMLQHLNWRFEGNFDLSNFAHYSLYNEDLHQIEMYLKSLKTQKVKLKKLDLNVEFEAGEMMLTEISRKFDLSEIKQELQKRGLMPVQSWSDSKNWFGLLLCRLQQV
ncbi:L-histidine N(alpha)-methyltransferase [Ancylothrix sp. C2]|uniref:L-histidine N(alpha)-methyltransferase n=1 Tax=Ancylothrix sp. D3o TaxID=2953691 RepID=UPI0021BA5833|nr:L-histidine N(alpha)-methyltransferase [Ancylothrix sp. D3o]MCT7951219.1 L-histidine N(alpha)-methyltransferase [Ancylothrix sp. D3o]